MVLADTFLDKLPPWPVTVIIVLASIGTFIGLAITMRRTGSIALVRSRNRTFPTFTLYLSSFVTAMLFTFVLGDWIAIDSIGLERTDNTYAQRIEGACVLALFFTIFFGNILLNKITWIRLILTVVPGSILTICLIIIHSAK